MNPATTAHQTRPRTRRRARCAARTPAQRTEHVGVEEQPHDGAGPDEEGGDEMAQQGDGEEDAGQHSVAASA